MCTPFFVNGKFRTFAHYNDKVSHILITVYVMNVRTTFLFCIATAIILFTAACSSKKDKEPKPPVAVSTVTVSESSSGSGHEYSGIVIEREGTALSFEVPGNIVTLRADNGDRVSRGQLLATVNPTSLRDAHNLTLSTLHQAQDAYRRFEPLHKQGVLSDIKWVEIQTKLEQAKSAEQMARTQLQRTSLTAPFAGVISERAVERGMNVMAGQKVYKLVDISRMDVRMSVPEAEVATIKEGDKARVTVSALGGQQYEAVVCEKGVEANALSHTYDIKLAVSATGGKLLPGMVCSIKMDGGSSATSGGTQALSVPLNAVKLDSDNRRFVWLAVGGKAKLQYVTIGDFTDNGIAITSGLHAGDRVITDGSQKVSDGMSVKIMEH